MKIRVQIFIDNILKLNSLIYLVHPLARGSIADLDEKKEMGAKPSLVNFITHIIELYNSQVLRF